MPSTIGHLAPDALILKARYVESTALESSPGDKATFSPVRVENKGMSQNENKVVCVELS
jgi:hypothetical protein